MKNTRSFLFVLAFIFSFFSYAQEATKMEEVMTYHNEVMAKMPNLVKLIGKLEPQVDSTKTGQKHQNAIDALKASNSSMMNWMQGFGERFTADEMMKGKALTAEKKAWLEEEEKKVKALRKEIDASIKNAEKLIKH